MAVDSLSKPIIRCRMKSLSQLAMGLFAAAALGTLSAPAAAQRAPLELAPAGKWVMDYQAEYCSLVRQFGEGDRQFTLVIQRASPRDNLRILLVSKSLPASLPNRSAQMRLSSMTSMARLFAFVGKSGELPSLSLPGLTFDSIVSPKGKQQTTAQPEPVEDATLVDALRWSELEQWKSISALSFGRPLKQEVILQTGPMDKPMTALNDCVLDLVARWGVDIDRHRTMRRTASPVTEPSTWLRDADYPSAALSLGLPGIVDFRLMIDPAGKVISCHPQWTTEPQFGRLVCALILKRARFEPAVDAAGQPVASFFASSVTFNIDY